MVGVSMLWLHNLDFQELVYVSHDVFDAYRKSHYKAGCHLGVISSYILQILVVHLRDIEGRLQKMVSIVANLVNVYGPVQQAAKTDWAVFRLMHWASLLQRAHPQDMWDSSHANELTAAKDAAFTLVADVGKAVKNEVQIPMKRAVSESQIPIIFVTSAWGWMSEQLHRVLRRWRVVSSSTPLLVLCRDRRAQEACAALSDLENHRGAVRCLEAPRRLGVEAIVAKYLVSFGSNVRKGGGIGMNWDFLLAYVCWHVSCLVSCYFVESEKGWKAPRTDPICQQNWCLPPRSQSPRWWPLWWTCHLMRYGWTLMYWFFLIQCLLWMANWLLQRDRNWSSQGIS